MTFDLNTIADIVRPHNEKLIAEGRADKLERENAKLRADNADMLAALQDVTELYCDLVNSGDCYGLSMPETAPAVKRANAAIAKATRAA